MGPPDNRVIVTLFAPSQPFMSAFSVLALLRLWSEYPRSLEHAVDLLLFTTVMRCFATNLTSCELFDFVCLPGPATPSFCLTSCLHMLGRIRKALAIVMRFQQERLPRVSIDSRERRYAGAILSLYLR